LHPVTKVIGLLEGLKKESGNMEKEEEATYMKFKYWCKASQRTLQNSIAKEKQIIDALSNKVSARKDEVDLLTQQLATLAEQVGTLQKSQKSASEVRSSRAKMYASSASYDSIISSIDQALDSLTNAGSSITRSALAQQKVQSALALVDSTPTRESFQKHGGLLIETSATPVTDAEKHFAKYYAFKSDNVIKLLENLKTQFEADKRDATKQETNSLRAFEIANQARKNALNAMQISTTTKTGELSDAKGELAAALKSLSDAQQDLEADLASLDQTHKVCLVKSAEWAERTQMRSREMQALDAAIMILSKVTGVDTEAPNNPRLPSSPFQTESTVLFQFVDPKMKAVQILRAQAHKSHSIVLERFAQQVEAHLSGPFADLHDKIDKMIFRLLAEQKTDIDHQNWCIHELDQTNSSKANREDQIDELHGKMDEQTATSQQLTIEIEESDGIVAKLVSHMREATEIRNIGKKENSLAEKEAQNAQKAIAHATAILQAFYKDSGALGKEGGKLIQRGIDLPDEPGTWSSSYTGVADPHNQPNGIITVLKSVAADFATMEANTVAQEQTDQKQYEKDMLLSKLDKARRMKEIDMKGQEKKVLDGKILSLKDKIKHTSGELAAVNKYLKDLEPACMHGNFTLESRQVSRSEEINALQEARTILEDAFLGSHPKKKGRGARFLQRA